MHALHSSDPLGATGSLITKSLGDSASFPIVKSRHELLRIAAQEGIRVPPWILVKSKADLDQWREPLPWVIKLGMSWGGAGVRVVYNRAEALRAYRAMARPIGVGRALKRLVINGDGFSMSPSLLRTVPEVIAQRFVPGEPASTAIACLRGRMLAHLSVRALGTQGPTGAATMVEVVEQPDMTSAGRRLAGRLQLSGLHGLDFIRDKSGSAWLIEFNPRATQVCHITVGNGASLAEAFVAARRGRLEIEPQVAPVGCTLAFFPQAWRSDPANPVLTTANHDVPWKEPALVKDLMAPPWPNRGYVARLWQKIFETDSGKDYWAGAAPVAASEDLLPSMPTITGRDSTADQKLPA